jgi:hypothetical protein
MIRNACTLLRWHGLTPAIRQEIFLEYTFNTAMSTVWSYKYDCPVTIFWNSCVSQRMVTIQYHASESLAVTILQLHRHYDRFTGGCADDYITLKCSLFTL